MTAAVLGGAVLLWWVPRW